MSENIVNKVLSDWSWEAMPAFAEGELSQPATGRSREFYGDHFDEGIRYRARVTLLQEVIYDGKKRIDLEAECIGGDGLAAEAKGKLLKAAFFFPLKSELVGLDPTSQEFRKKSFLPRLFNTFVVACGHPERKGEDKTPLDRMIGDVFEFTAKDRTVKGRETRNIKGEEMKYPDYLSSYIKEVFKPGSKVSADNEPLVDTAKAVEDSFGF